MAFKGAFAAGFTKSVGSGIKQGFEDRSLQHDKYLDNMIGSAKALAPKYAASKAAAENGVVQMDNLVRDFGLTKSEVVALAQTGDFSTTYETLYQERDKLVAQGLNPGLLSPATIMKSVQIPKSAKMEGTPEDALRFILGGFTANLAKDPTNKSESHVNGSFGQSVAKALMANPRASAEETAAAMQVAGISVSELNNWSARQNSPRQPYAGVTSTGNLVVEGTDYKGTDYAKTSNDFTQRIGSNLYVVDPVTSIPNYTTALGEGKKADAAAAQERKQAVILAGANFAKLEKGLVQQGYTQGFNFRANRDPLLLEIRNSLQTPADVDAFNAAMSEGTILKSVLEAGPDGLSDDEVQDILYPKPEEEGKGSGNTPPVIKTTVEPAETGAVVETAVAAVVPQTAAERLTRKALGDVGDDLELSGNVTSRLDSKGEGFTMPEVAAEGVTTALLAGQKTGAALATVFEAVKPDGELSASYLNATDDMTSALNRGAANAADFIYGVMGGTEQTNIAEWLRADADRIDAKPEVTAESVRKKNLQIAEAYVDGMNSWFGGLLSPDAKTEATENVANVLTRGSDTPAAKALSETIQEREDYARSKRKEKPTPPQVTEEGLISQRLDDTNRRVSEEDAAMNVDFPQPLDAVTFNGPTAEDGLMSMPVEQAGGFAEVMQSLATASDEEKSVILSKYIGEEVYPLVNLTMRGID